MLRWVTKEHTWHRARAELVRASGGHVRITKTTKNPKSVLGWRPTMKTRVRYERANGFAGVSIDEICCSG
jgi:hypothetical protein